jgi:hypothetical protein
MNELKFRVTPKVGKTINYRGQRYVMLEAWLHRNSKGELSVVLKWRSECPECGRPFTITSGLTTKNLTRRCSKHRKLGKPVAIKPRSLAARRTANG